MWFQGRKAYRDKEDRISIWHVVFLKPSTNSFQWLFCSNNLFLSLSFFFFFFCYTSVNHQIKVKAVSGKSDIHCTFSVQKFLRPQKDLYIFIVGFLGESPSQFSLIFNCIQANEMPIDVKEKLKKLIKGRHKDTKCIWGKTEISLN